MDLTEPGRAARDRHITHHDAAATAMVVTRGRRYRGASLTLRCTLDACPCFAQLNFSVDDDRYRYEDPAPNIQDHERQFLLEDLCHLGGNDYRGFYELPE